MGGKDNIWRNITTFITEAPSSRKEANGYIEVNAWYDKREGKNWFRLWNHKQMDTGRIDPERWCHKAYETVMSWNKKILGNKDPLSAEAVAVLEESMPQYKL